jgi:hypothetical protein
LNHFIFIDCFIWVFAAMRFKRYAFNKIEYSKRITTNHGQAISIAPSPCEFNAFVFLQVKCGLRQAGRGKQGCA